LPEDLSGSTKWQYTFSANFSGMVQFMDEVGNVGWTGIAIDWIDNDNPIGVITYSPNGATS
jgi:ABC-type uncharacterized transport system permease subunit